MALALSLGFFSSGSAPWSGLALRPAYGQDFAAAGQHFASGQDAFAQGKYELAAKEFQAAYDITRDPTMLVNIGESWQRAGDGPKALVGYRAYLAAQPQAPDRAEIEGRIRTIESALSGATPGGVGQTPAPAPTANPAGTDKPPTAAPPAATDPALAKAPGAPDLAAGVQKPIPVPPGKTETPTPAQPTTAPDAAAKADAAASKPVVTPPEGPASRLRTAGWVTVAVAVALATSGAIVGLGAQDRADELRRRTTLLIGNQPPVYDSGQAEAYTTLQSEGNAYNKAGIALLSAAGAVAVTAGVLFIADYARRPKAETKPKSSWALLPTLVPGSAAAGARPGALSVTSGLVASGSF